MSNIDLLPSVNVSSGLQSQQRLIEVVQTLDYEQQLDFCYNFKAYARDVTNNDALTIKPPFLWTAVRADGSEFDICVVMLGVKPVDGQHPASTPDVHTE